MITVTGVRKYPLPPAVLHLIDPSSDPAVQPVGLSGRTLQFSDEFNGTTLDTLKWDTTYPAWPRFTSQSPGGNRTNTNNSNWYADDHATLTGAGSLDLLLEPDSTTYPGLLYKSGMVQSLKSYTLSPGSFVEVRAYIARLDEAIWPAAWLSNAATDTWPPEIDFWEHYGLTNDYLVNTYGGPSTTSVTVPSVDNTVWHTYGADWTSSDVKFYLDGTLVNTTSVALGGTQYVILNLAADAAVAAAITSPSHMYVDYVRAWR